MKVNIHTENTFDLVPESITEMIWLKNWINGIDANRTIKEIIIRVVSSESAGSSPLVFKPNGNGCLSENPEEVRFSNISRESSIFKNY